MSRKRFLDEEDAVCFGSQDTDNQEVIPLHQVQNFGRTATVDRSNRVREPVFPKICAQPHKYLKLISWNIWNLKNALKCQSSTVFKLIAQHKPDVFFVQVPILKGQKTYNLYCNQINTLFEIIGNQAANKGPKRFLEFTGWL